MAKYKTLLVFGLLNLLGLAVSAQSEEQLQANITKQRDLQEQDISKSLEMAIANYETAKKIKSDRLGQTMGYLSRAYYDLENLDSTNKYLELAIKENKKKGNKKRLARNYTTKGMIASDAGQNEEAIHWFSEAKDMFIMLGDTFNLADCYLRITESYIWLDRLDEGMVSAKHCYDYCIKVNYKEYAGYALNAMGVIHMKIGNLEKSIDMQNQALRIFEEENLKFSVFQTESNLGVAYKKGKQYQKALKSYTKALQLSRELKYPRGEMGVHANLGNLHNLMGNYSQAKNNFDAALKISEKVKMAAYETDIHINHARALLNLGSIAKAKDEINIGLKMAKEIGSIELEMDAHEIAKEIYQKTGEIDLALVEMEAFKVLNDSLFNLAKVKQINELQSKYETINKDAEIASLNNKTELQKIRNQELLLGIVFLLITTSAIFYFILEKRKRDKVIDAAKLLSTQKELEFKQKELTSKVLQLARKGEFLNKLETDLENLKTNIDGSVNKTAAKISKLIKRDTINEAQWDQFAMEFSHLHQGFLDALTAKHGSFTKSEIRLISLMKMNLSSKDMADVLNISAEGIKKARYRLRKKLELSSDDVIQTYLFSF